VGWNLEVVVLCSEVVIFKVEGCRWRFVVVVGQIGEGLFGGAIIRSPAHHFTRIAQHLMS